MSRILVLSLILSLILLQILLISTFWLQIVCWVLAFYLFVEVLLHVRGRPSGPKSQGSSAPTSLGGTQG